MKRTPDIPLFYLDYIKKQRPEQWEDITPVRSMLRHHLWEGQGRVCAYTELRIGDSVSSCCHIDHFKTRNLFPELTFEYSNLLVACNSEYYGAKYKDKQVKSKEDYKNLINPVNEQMADHVQYTFEGKAMPLSGSRKGENTISIFNLNEKSLLNQRKRIIHYLRSMKDFSEDEVVMYIGEFETMVRQLYQEIEALGQ